MKGSDEYAFALRTDKAHDPVSHLLGRLIGEGHRENGRRRDALFTHQIGDPVGYDPRLSRARAGQYEEGPLGVHDGFFLVRVEIFQDCSFGHGIPDSFRTGIVTRRKIRRVIFFYLFLNHAPSYGRTEDVRRRFLHSSLYFPKLDTRPEKESGLYLLKSSSSTNTKSKDTFFCD